jgi:hypothetical protein
VPIFDDFLAIFWVFDHFFNSLKKPPPVLPKKVNFTAGVSTNPKKGQKIGKKWLIEKNFSPFCPVNHRSLDL